MAELGERTGRHDAHRRVRRAPGGRARGGRHGLRRRDRARDRRRAQRSAASASACCRCACTGRSRPRRCSTRCPRAVRRIAVLDRTKEPGSIGEPLFLDVVAALAEAHADGERAVMPTVIGGRYGLSSKEFTPGMVAGVFAELARERPRRRFTIGIDDDVSRHEPALRRGARHRVAGHRPRRLLRPRRRRDRRREQEHDQDPRLRGRPARPGLLRLRLQEVRLADRVAPALRPAADPRALPRRRRRASSAATTSGCSSSSTCSAGRRPAPRCCSTARTRPTRCGTRCRARSRSRSSPRASTSTSIDAGRIAREAGLAGRINIDPADLLLRHLRRAAARGGDRPDQGGDRQDLRQARRRGGGAQPRGRRSHARGPAPRRAARRR